MCLRVEVLLKTDRRYPKDTASCLFFVLSAAGGFFFVQTLLSNATMASGNRQRDNIEGNARIKE